MTVQINAVAVNANIQKHYFRDKFDDLEQDNVWFHQDGATYIARETLTLLKRKFGKRAVYISMICRENLSYYTIIDKNEN